MDPEEPGVHDIGRRRWVLRADRRYRLIAPVPGASRDGRAAGRPEPMLEGWKPGDCEDKNALDAVGDRLSPRMRSLLDFLGKRVRIDA